MSDPLLLGAAEYLAENGHHKGTFYPNDERYGIANIPEEELADFNPPACALGAMGIVSRRMGIKFWGERFTESATRLTDHLGFLFGDGIASWNDAESTTVEDVILAMKTAGTE